jgi:hypothetical protein
MSEIAQKMKEQAAERRARGELWGSELLFSLRTTPEKDWTEYQRETAKAFLSCMTLAADMQANAAAAVGALVKNFAFYNEAYRGIEGLLRQFAIAAPFTFDPVRMLGLDVSHIPRAVASLATAFAPPETTDDDTITEIEGNM